MKQIAQAFVKAQSEMSNAVKGNTNPFFKSKYADLNSIREAVLPILNQNKIAVLQPIVSVDGKNFIRTILLHESGEMLEDSLTEIVYSKQNDAQAQGSGITYARRYALQSLVCVGADDDDGNLASKEHKTPTQTTPEAKPPVTLTPENHTKALNADLKGIQATLKAITSKTLIATAEQILELQNKEIELTNKK